MKKSATFTIGITGILCCTIVLCNSAKQTIKSGRDKTTFNRVEEEEGKSPVPNDHWYNVRSYPFGFSERDFVQQMNKVRESAEEVEMNRDVELGNVWLAEGPGNIGGRFTALEKDPADANTIYAGAANGGIFKTTDGGTTWTPIFDDQAYLAIGEIKVDPTDANRIWVGTGDRDFGGGSHLGNGVYLSTDGGTSWMQMGLEETGIITEIHIDPTDPNRIFVGTLGNAYEKTTDRGVYRTTDGGTTWTNVLLVSDSSGVCDMVMDPTNSDILYASFHNRINQPFNPKVSGPDSRIYKTTDGGDTWIQLTVGLPSGDNARIGIDIVPSTPNTLYALYVDGTTLNPIDVYKTTNGGSSWTAMNVFSGGSPLDPSVMGGFGWYFGQIHVNPYAESQLTVQGVDQWYSPDGGSSWFQNVPDWWTYDVHADKHDILYLNSSTFIIATDGGLYKTTNTGATWTDIENIPVTQFYHIDVDPINDGFYGGGAQDNGTSTGNQPTFNSWDRLLGGDGFRLTWMESLPGEAFFEVQNGALYYYDGFSASSIDPPIVSPDRVNWDMPYLANETSGDLFVGTSKVMIMESFPFGSYVDISTDLTKVPTGSFIGDESRHTISEIEQDKLDDGYLYAGTTDGMVWRGQGSGTSWTWTDVTGSLPDRYVTALRSSPNNEGTIYVAFSGYTVNDDESYLYMSTDYGDTWTDISGDLPSITVNDVVAVPNYNDDYLFAALDGGVYFSENGGANWSYVGTGMPLCTISELELDIPNKKLIAGTYSRSMWSYDVSWLTNLDGPPFGTGIAESEEDQFVCYPNPVEDLLYFCGISDAEIVVYDLNGRQLLNKKVVDLGNYQQINLGSLPAGTYVLQVGDKRKKIIKK